MACCRERWESAPQGGKAGVTGFVVSRRDHGKNLIFLDAVFDCNEDHHSSIISESLSIQNEDNVTCKRIPSFREEKIQIVLNKRTFATGKYDHEQKGGISYTLATRGKKMEKEAVEHQTGFEISSPFQIESFKLVSDLCVVGTVWSFHGQIERTIRNELSIIADRVWIIKVKCLLQLGDAEGIIC